MSNNKTIIEGNDYMQIETNTLNDVNIAKQAIGGLIEMLAETDGDNSNGLWAILIGIDTCLPRFEL